MQSKIKIQKVNKTFIQNNNETTEVLKDIKLKEVKLEQESNIKLISLTLLVSNFDISKLVKFLQL